MSHAHVLIADDDDVTLEMLDAALQDRHKVTTARSGHQALDLTRTQGFDLVLLDVDMPGMDGYATCQALKSSPHTADLPVIFLSAKVNIEERLRGYRVGAQDYLTKPFEVPELTAKIALAVAQRERNRQLHGQIKAAMNTAQTSATRADDVAVVLALQRHLRDCATYQDMMSAFFIALDKVGFEGCLRLTGRQGVLSGTSGAECSALEHSILDHLENLKGPSVVAVGDNTCFRFGPVLMLIRHLPLTPSTCDGHADEVDRLCRVKNNIALMAEGLLSRMRSLDVETEKAALEEARQTVTLTRDALVDISAQQHADQMHMGQVFQRMNHEIEQSFIHLGLTEQQEEHLSGTLQRYINEALAIFDHSHEVESHLNRLISRLHAQH